MWGWGGVWRPSLAQGPCLTGEESFWASSFRLRKERLSSFSRRSHSVFGSTQDEIAPGTAFSLDKTTSPSHLM